MCSITGDGTDELGRLGQAIDDLADARTTHPELSMQELATRLAAIWQMVAELDPELARRLSEYGR